MRAVRITEFGGPEVLQPADVPEPAVADGQVLIDVRAAGVNFADTHQSENSYLAAQSLPLIPGAEVVGVARTGPHAGRRVVALVAGGYAEVVAAHHHLVWPVPDEVSDGAALALVLQGTTAWHLLRTSAHLAAGESVVVHAAAGGVGSLAVQLARLWGAGRVIAVASTPAKRALATELGAHTTVDLAGAELAVQVRHALVSANDGAGVDVVLEMTGGETFAGSLAALAPFGRLVVFGMASRRPAPPVDPRLLMGSSRAVIGFWLYHLMGRPGALDQAMSELMTLVREGRLRPVVGTIYPLDQARQAHQELRERRTVGKVVLQVSRDAD
ncbi:MAG: NADPH:quinone oxidoreductase family protein [Kineosporiaceae bacterium]|nr:NADPH:quinone oxidoreductase family protein [Kineosporiaceae bacterium]MBK7624924.1 NADPH:quinone oxidoreductase family protein [Kineosporiaceae bacterium]MBK8076697.1 NADPH:quinone oxidoreductase family protein [Kineosporiaceae bacterium]